MRVVQFVTSADSELDVIVNIVQRDMTTAIYKNRVEDKEILERFMNLPEDKKCFYFPLKLKRWMFSKTNLIEAEIGRNITGKIKIIDYGGSLNVIERYY